MGRTRLGTMVFLLLVSAGFLFADDREDILALIEDYSQAQSQGDMMQQKGLMTDDRTFISGGRRLTNQELNMSAQKAVQDRNRQVDPDAQVFVHAVDPHVRVYGDAALASFYWHINTVWGAEYTRAMQGNMPPGWASLAVSMFLVKDNGSWKIAHTHLSPTNN